MNRRPVLSFFLLLNSLAIFIMWPLMLAAGAYPHGVMAYQPEGTIPILHLVAEFLMAGVTLAGAAALWVGAKWAAKLTLFGLGMFCYSAINSLGWALRNDFLMAIPMVSALLLCAIVVPELISGRPMWRAAEDDEEAAELG